MTPTPFPLGVTGADMSALVEWYVPGFLVIASLVSAFCLAWWASGLFRRSSK